MHNKKKITQKVLASLMTFVMLFGLLPMSALAAVDDNDYQLMLSGNLGNGLAMWAGEKLAGGVVSSIGGYPMNQAMGKIFGTQTDQVMQVLEEVKKGIQDIRGDISKISAKIDKVELRSLINNYGDFICEYIGTYNVLLARMSETDPVKTKNFLTGVYSCEGNYANYKVGTKTLLNATTTLGERLMYTKLTEGGTCNIFGAIDLYDRYTNTWEHNGYALREDFRNKALGIYTLFSCISQLSCQTMIDIDPGDNEARDWAKELQDNAARVNEMVKRTAVIRHPNIRIARDLNLGQDLCAFYPDVKVSFVTACWDPVAWAKFSQNADIFSSVEYLETMTNDKNATRIPWSDGWIVQTNQPTPEEYLKIFNNYGGKQSLYNIFFDADKGNFNNLENRPAGSAFLCDCYVSRRYYDGWINWESKNHVGNNGEVYWWWKFSAARFKSGSALDDYFDASNAFIINKYLGEVKQGSLQGTFPPSLGFSATATISGLSPSYELPYEETITLIIDQNEGNYQWSVNKNDGFGFMTLEGETNQAYTLPTLKAEMNGWQYSCTTAIDSTEPEEEPEYIYSKPVTLDLSGEGIIEAVYDHYIGNAAELKEAFAKVVSGDWSGSAHTLWLTDDILYDDAITFDGFHNISIDLNGHSLTIQPGYDTQPNVNPMSNNPQTAALCLNQDIINIKDSSTEGSGSLNILAGVGVDYGIYAVNNSRLTGKDGEKINVTFTGTGTAVYAEGDGTVIADILCGISAVGTNVYGIECINDSSVVVSGDVTVQGTSACGVYAASFDGESPFLSIIGDLIISGENSRAIFWNANNQILVKGNVTVEDGGIEGIAINAGMATIEGDITAPNYAINARGNYEEVYVKGNVLVTKENAVAVLAVGAGIKIDGNVTSENNGGIGLLATTWVSTEDATVQSAEVTVDGEINAVIPLLIERTPIKEDGESTEFDDPYNVFAVPEKGESIVKAMPGALMAKAIFLVTFDKNGGDIESIPAMKEVIRGGSGGSMPIDPVRTGFTFEGWNTMEDGSGTTYTSATIVTAPMTVFALWHKIESEESYDESLSPGVETPKIEVKITDNQIIATTFNVANVGSMGGATSSVSLKQVGDAINQALAEAEKLGNDMMAIVEIVTQVYTETTSVETTIPKEALELIAESETALIVNSSIASLRFDAKTMSALANELTEDVKITTSKIKAADLSDEIKQVVGDHPVFNFSLTGGDKTYSEFESSVVVTIPYIPKAGENTDLIVIYYINAKGDLEFVNPCAYDPETGTVSFKTNHFSQYAIGYNKVNFKDVAEKAWYHKAVSFVAARGITTGTGSGNYSPEAKLTRGDFLVMMMRSYGIVADKNSINNFEDAGNTYYTGYLAAAKRLGISEGIGNNLFAPGKEITRQEMFTLLYNTLMVLNELPQGNVGKLLADFTDRGEIADWAKEAMNLFVKAGLVSGDGGRLNPAGDATRAQTAQVLYGLLTNK